MDHKTALNRILSSACPQTFDDDTKIIPGASWEVSMDPDTTLKNIRALCSLVDSEDPTRMATLIELEEYIYSLRRWIDRGGFKPDNLDDNR